MKSVFKEEGFFAVSIVFLLLLLSACSNESPTATIKDTANAPVKTKTTKVNNLIIADASIEQEDDQIVVDTIMKNNSTTAQELKPELFALVVNNTILSPNNKSEIPKQIPAGTNAEFKIQFDQNNVEGNNNIRLAYQPVNKSESEQFYTIGNISIKKPVAKPKTVKKTTTNTNTNSNSNNNNNNDSQTTTQDSTDTNTDQIELQNTNIDGQLTIDVPIGWIRSQEGSVDSGGYKYVNPKDPNEEMIVVYSACAGCGYTDANTDGPPDPEGLIPDLENENVVSKNILRSTKYGAAYQYYLPGNPYTGNGVVKMSKSDGYCFAEIVLPTSKTPIATTVLNSLEFSGVH